MNAHQRRIAKRKVLIPARAMGLAIPTWASTHRIEQMVREERNRQARAKGKRR